MLKKPEVNEFVVYGIYIDEELVYIGKTRRSFYKRYYEHSSSMDKYGVGAYEGTQGALYAAMWSAKTKG